MKKHIPNIITLFNLTSGLVALFYVFQKEWLLAFAFVLLGILFDFFDGLAARTLNVSSAVGLQLDSLADMVTSGVVPAFAMFFLLQNTLQVDLTQGISFDFKHLAPFIGLFISLGSAYRLAKFNVDERQSTSFIGLPTPANTLFIMSLPLIAYQQDIIDLNSFLLNPYTLIAISLLSAYMLNAELPLFSLKFKDFSWQNNKEKFILVGLSLVLIPTLQFISIPLIIIIYILLSLIFKTEKA
jgi:CDP-diacylglycerol--serine O-phosphatidyltransferase